MLSDIGKRFRQLSEKAAKGPVALYGQHRTVKPSDPSGDDWHARMYRHRCLMQVVPVGEDPEIICSTDCGDNPDGMDERLAQDELELTLLAELRNHTGLIFAVMREVEASRTLLRYDGVLNQPLPKEDREIAQYDYHKARAATDAELEKVQK